MNRFLIALNAFGVLVLSALCIMQWRVNEKLNQDLASQQKANHEQAAKLDESAKAFKGCSADLETFREQIIHTHASLKDKQTQLLDLERQIRLLTAERDQLKVGVEAWQTAVASRDQRLKEANDKIRSLAADRNDAVVRYNEVVTKYNATVKDLNAAIARINKMVASASAANTREQEKKTP